jgi:arabinose-5-phosphate isomerase
MNLHTDNCNDGGYSAAQVGLRAVYEEAAALKELAESMAFNYFTSAISAVREAQSDGGRVHVTGMGKSSHVGRKLASTLSSTGTPAVFLDPVAAQHGDSGQLQPGDLVIAVSHSGRTREVLGCVRLLKENGASILSMVGDAQSPLALESEVVLHVPVSREACPLRLAPTSSTTCQLVVGDGLAAALMAAREFTSDEFFSYHPEGALGQRAADGAQRIIEINGTSVLKANGTSGGIL